MLILKQQKVSFKDISSEYDYDNLSPKTIKTKLNDGPNLYRSFFEISPRYRGCQSGNLASEIPP